MIWPQIPSMHIPDTWRVRQRGRLRTYDRDVGCAVRNAPSKVARPNLVDQFAYSQFSLQSWRLTILLIHLGTATGLD